MAYNFNKDFEVPNPPTDGISALAWSSKANHLAVASWDNSLRVYDVAYQGATIQRASGAAMTSHEAPLLCAAWSGDGKTLFAGGVDGRLRVWPVGQTASVLNAHSSGIKAVAMANEIGVACTGSWDKTLKYWDGRSPNPSAVVQLPERCYALDVAFPLCVVATADRQIIVYDLNKPTVEFKRINSPLRCQSRCIACFPDKTGFAVGSIEGRVGIHYLDDRDAGKNFAFRCHRDGNDVYAVDCIAFHPQYGTLATTGSDGSFNFWDKEQKQRIKAFARAPTAIPCAQFSADGRLFAYAVSYDGGKGSAFYTQQSSNYVFIHYNQDAEFNEISVSLSFASTECLGTPVLVCGSFRRPPVIGNFATSSEKCLSVSL